MEQTNLSCVIQPLERVLHLRPSAVVAGGAEGLGTPGVASNPFVCLFPLFLIAMRWAGLVFETQE